MLAHSHPQSLTSNITSLAGFPSIILFEVDPEPAAESHFSHIPHYHNHRVELTPRLYVSSTTAGPLPVFFPAVSPTSAQYLAHVSAKYFFIEQISERMLAD